MSLKKTILIFKLTTSLEPKVWSGYFTNKVSYYIFDVINNFSQFFIFLSNILFVNFNAKAVIQKLIKILENYF